MDKKYLESSEFYNKRFNNFSTLIIIPIFLLFVVVVLFSIFMKREVTIESFGELGSKKSIPIVQSPSNSSITKNYLSEGKYVKKGSTLIVYKNATNDIRLNSLKDQKNNINDQVKQLNLLQKGVESNQDTFTSDDTFGYRNLLKSYLNQRNIYDIENRMLKDKTSFSNDKVKQLSSLYDDTIKQKNANLQTYQTLFNAIKSDKSYPSNSTNSYIYDSYKAELKNAENANDKLTVKQSYLKDLQSHIDSINDEIKSSQEQKDSLKDFSNPNYDIDSNTKKLESLQNNQLNSISEELVKLKEKEKSLDENIKELENISKNSYVTAEKSGVIHMDNPSLKGARYIGSGSELAKIYPVFKTNATIKIQSYVSSKDISSIKKGQHMRLQITRNVPKPIIIDGIINNISVAPVPINNGTYYIVVAQAKNNSKIISKIHYGMSGKTNIITGKETFFKYYKDKLLDKS